MSISSAGSGPGLASSARRRLTTVIAAEVASGSSLSATTNMASASEA